MRGAISLQAVLEVLGEFDEFGGANIGLVAWDLYVDVLLVADAWGTARTAGLIAPAGYDQHEHLWRLTPSGWAVVQGQRASAVAGPGRVAVARDLHPARPCRHLVSVV